MSSSNKEGKQKTSSSSKTGKQWLDKAMKRKILIWSLRIFVGMVAFFFLMVLFVYLGVFGKLPNVEDLKKINNNTASLVYSADGKIMGSYHIENRQTISNKDISEYVQKALIATEDSRFFEHKGLDFISLGRVIVKTMFLGDHSQGGGSTISQQLAKNLYPRKKYGPLSMLVNKIREAFVASRLEKTFNKEQILTMYLNTVPFGEDVYGIEAASQRFFQKRSRFLNPAEAATLVGMLAANTAYNPRLNPEKSTGRRNIVLDRMRKQGFLKPEETAKWKVSPMKIDYNRIDANTGIAPYFRERIRLRVEEILEDKYGDKYDLHTDGLKIYTTIDSRLQSYAESAVSAHMSELQKEFIQHWKGKEPWHASPDIFQSAIKKSNRYKFYKEQGLSHKDILQAMRKKVKMNVLFPGGEKVVEMSPIDSIRHYLKILNVGFFAVDARNGQILTWVGGVNHKAFQYDHVTSRRQVGSTFKPFVYTAALLNNIEPCEFFSNERITYDDYDDWSPANSDGEYGGYYSMKGALANSVNTVAAQLIMRTGADAVVDVAESMGIESDIPSYPSIALGTPDLSLYEMVSAYAVFANGGHRIEPVGLLRIEDKNGKVLFKQKGGASNETVLDPDIARTMAELMKGVINEGTGRALRGGYGITCDLAGKTGTTNDNTDGWFIGYTPTIVAGCWVGNDNPVIHFRTTGLGQGAHTAMPIFGKFMGRVQGDPRFNKYTVAFPELPDYIAARLNCESFTNEAPPKVNQGGFFQKLFNSGEDEKATQKQKTEEVEKKSPPRKTDEEKQGLLDKMKDLFRKKKE
jgi:penicillin-binding protein 1A